jgi:hypothetical protein
MDKEFKKLEGGRFGLSGFSKWNRRLKEISVLARVIPPFFESIFLGLFKSGAVD